jgi:protein-tyrosine phosphatase
MDTITQLTNNLFIGGYGAAMNEQLMINNNITQILTLNNKLNLITEFKLPYSHLNDYHIVDIHDTVNFDITIGIDQCTKIIHNAINNNENILVHCYCGVSRSVIVCIGYFIQYKQMQLFDAFEYIRRKRNMVEPSFNFINLIIRHYGLSYEENIYKYELYCIFKNKYNVYIQHINTEHSIQLKNKMNNSFKKIFQIEYDDFEKKLFMTVLF